MREKLKLLFELNRGTWIKNLSMFLCAILVVESFGMPLGVQASANGSNSDVTVVYDKESGIEVSDNDGSSFMESIGEESLSVNDLTYEDKDGTNLVAEDGSEEEFVLPEVRYDFVEIDYSDYASEQVNEDVLAAAYMSQAVESLDKAGLSVEDLEYDPYISNPSAVTAVRNQGSTDTCWAFSTTAVAELASIRQGLSSSSQWYSPYHMAYFLYHHVEDPLGGTTGDTNTAVTAKSPDFLKGGGNLFMALFYMSNWSGLIKEEKAPFDESVSQETTLSASTAYDADVILKNGYMISTGDNQVQDIKQAVVEYGGVAIHFQTGSQYENASTGAYYCDTTGTNHAVVIVGWDDNYSVDNFNTSCRPSSNGAWIVKNSWGSSQGREGYNYISYEDKSIAFPIAVELMEPGTYDNNYHYDGSLAVTDASVVAVESGGSVANVFTAHASESGYDESLEAVSIALKSTDVNYKISIYKYLEADEDGVLNPSSGKLLLTQEGKTGRAGVYTITLNESVCLTSGDTFSVVFTLESKDGTAVETWMERNYNYVWVTGKANIQENQSFWKLTSEHAWDDLYNITISKDHTGGLARIKAFTNTLSTISTKDINMFRITVSENSFVADGTAKCPEVTILKGTQWLVQGTDYEVEYKNNISAGEGQVIVTGIGAYTGTVTIPIYLYEYSVDECPGHDFNDAKCINCGYQIKEQTLTGKKNYTKTYLDEAFLLDVSGNTTTLHYESDNESVATVDANGLVTIKGMGVANITATAEKSNEYQMAQLEIQVQVQRARIYQVQLLENTFYYDGIAKKPAIEVQNKQGTILTQEKDYTVQYSNNNEIGTATVLVTGIGNYTGVVKKSFTIQRMPEALCSHVYLNGECRYCGYERKVQQITGTLSYEKLYSDKGFWLDATTDGDSVLTYESDDASVVTVDEKGYVTIHGTGIAYIYVKAKETSLYYADMEQILVEILPGKANIVVPDSTIEKAYGSKSFTLKATSNSDGKKTYKSANKKIATISSKGKVTIKGYGKTTFTITTAETDLYEKATKKVTITVVPKKATLTKVKATGGGSVRLTWKKNKTVDGYQFQYSTSKNFNKSVKTKKIKSYKNTSATLKLKKNKTYYFRIRSYKKVGKKTYYGAYSAIKKVKAK